MNAYLSIFSDVLRLVTFQDRRRPVRRDFAGIDDINPAGAGGYRTRRSVALKVGDGLPCGRPLRGF